PRRLEVRRELDGGLEVARGRGGLGAAESLDTLVRHVDGREPGVVDGQDVLCRSFARLVEVEDDDAGDVPVDRDEMRRDEDEVPLALARRTFQEARLDRDPQGPRQRYEEVR